MKTVSNIISGSVLITIAVSAGVVSLSANTAFGLEQSMVMGLILFLAEAGRITIPLVAALKGWNTWFKSVMLVCFLASVSAALANFANHNAVQLLKVENANDDNSRAKADYDAIRAELATIKVSGSVEVMTAMVAGLKEKAEDEAKNGFCGKKCIAAKDKWTAALAELAQVSRKADLESKLTGAQTKLDTSKKMEVSGASVMIAAFTGVKAEKISMVESFYWGAIAILIVEVLVYLSIPGFHFLFLGFGRVEEVEAPVATAEVVSLGQSRKERALQGLVALIRSTSEGGIYGSGRSLATQLKVSPSTFAEYLKEWEDRGLIKITEISAHKKRFSLAA